jgi:hypothetical protein
MNRQRGVVDSNIRKLTRGSNSFHKERRFGEDDIRDVSALATIPCNILCDISTSIFYNRTAGISRLEQ